MSKSSQALWESGIRAVVAQTLTDEGGAASWSESEEVVARWGTRSERRVFAGLGPRATDTCSDQLLARVRDRMEQLGALTFIHVAQSRGEVQAALRRGDKGCVHLLHRLGLLRPEVVAVHCIYLEPEEMDLLAATGTRVAHCPVSNAKVEGVVARCWQLWRAGVALGLGTDCAACNNAMDLWFDLKFAALFHKTAAADPTALPARVALSWVTREAAVCVDMRDHIGSLRPGACGRHHPEGGRAECGAGARSLLAPRLFRFGRGCGYCGRGWARPLEPGGVSEPGYRADSLRIGQD